MVFDELISFFKYCKYMSNDAVWCPCLDLRDGQWQDQGRSLHSDLTGLLQLLSPRN